VQIQFEHDSGPVSFDRSGADIQERSYFLIGLANSD
jgi:hypothetical protein